jgi:hypothetical protein
VLGEFLAPLAKWGAVAGVVLAVFGFLYRRFRRGEVARHTVGELEAERRARADALDRFRVARRRLGARARRGFARGMRDRQD